MTAETMHPVTCENCGGTFSAAWHTIRCMEENGAIEHVDWRECLSHLKAEDARLRALVEAAYREAHAKGGEQATDFYRLPDEDADWAASDARKALGD